MVLASPLTNLIFFLCNSSKERMRLSGRRPIIIVFNTLKPHITYWRGLTL
jgi:hypothetical protein